MDREREVWSMDREREAQNDNYVLWTENEKCGLWTENVKSVVYVQYSSLSGVPSSLVVFTRNAKMEKKVIKKSRDLIGTMKNIQTQT